jgi:hypothetical protein
VLQAEQHFDACAYAQLKDWREMWDITLRNYAAEAKASPNYALVWLLQNLADLAPCLWLLQELEQEKATNAATLQKILQAEKERHARSLQQQFEMV